MTTKSTNICIINQIKGTLSYLYTSINTCTNASINIQTSIDAWIWFTHYIQHLKSGHIYIYIYICQSIHQCVMTIMSYYIYYNLQEDNLLYKNISCNAQATNQHSCFSSPTLYISMCVYIYIYICVCVCVCVYHVIITVQHLRIKHNYVCQNFRA